MYVNKYMEKCPIFVANSEKIYLNSPDFNTIMTMYHAADGISNVGKY